MTEPCDGLRVALDLTPAICGTTGIARYATELRRGLGELGIDLVPFAIGRATYPVPPGVRHIPIPLRVVQRSWRLTGRPRLDRLARGVDLVHSIDLELPPSRRPVVVTIHDLAAVERPDLHPARSVSQQQLRINQLDRAAHVLAISHATANALVRHGYPAERITVTPLGPSRVVLRDVVRRHGGEGVKTILVVGELAHRKGLDVLFKALAQLDHHNVKVVSVGPDGPAGEELRSLAASLGLDVSFLGRVDDTRLADLYGSATMLCFPSHAEGFGLPLLEAMAAGLPIVTSDLDVTREVTGGIAAFASPGEIDSLAEALGSLLDDEGARASLSERGLKWVSAFTWERTAQTTVAGYRAALEGAAGAAKS